jgi:hypothetical protein
LSPPRSRYTKLTLLVVVLDGRGNVNNRITIGTTTIDDGEFEDYSEPQQETSPMFSHECFGSQSVSASVDSNEGSVDPLTPMMNESSRFIDIKDPRVEQFPHDGRKSILAELQKIMTNTDEDRSVPEGVPPSPVVLPTGQGQSSLAEAESPAGRLSAPRELLGSVNSVQSQMSLESIEEGPEDENYEIQRDQSLPSGKRSPRYHATSEWMGKAIESHTPAMEQSANQPTVRLEAPSDDEYEGHGSLSIISNSKDNALLRERNLTEARNRPSSQASIYTIQSNHSIHSITQTAKSAG